MPPHKGAAPHLNPTPPHGRMKGGPLLNPHKMPHDLTHKEVKRKGGVLARHFGGAHALTKPLRDAKGAPTPHALMAKRVGEPVPTTKAHVRRLGAMGRAMLKGLRK